MQAESIASKVYLFIIGLSGFQAYAMILAILFACGLGLPVPEDITLFAAGFLAFKGRITLTGAFLVGMIGVLVGDSFMYWIGRIFGRKVFQWPLFRRMFTEARIKKAEEKIQKNARIICFTSRFAPGLRAPIYLTSGIMGVPFHVFFVMDALAALISVPVWVYLAYFLGDKIESLLEIAKTAKLGVGIVIGVLVLGLILFKLRKRILGKRLLNA
ncbi:MAG: DedA family protein [Proteobacteria bacterium]|nr:DedA family protein [Pseudomonadota bacterium]